MNCWTGSRRWIIGNVYPDMDITAVTNDNRKVSPGSIFVAIKGEKSDGHDYIESALGFRQSGWPLRFSFAYVPYGLL